MIYRVESYPITSKVQECCGLEFAAKLGEFDYSLLIYLQIKSHIMNRLWQKLLLIADL